MTPEIENTEIAKRFFLAYQYLKDLGEIRNRVEFCELIKVNRPNFIKQEQDPSRSIIKLSWLAILVVKYGISADWLLTGRGKMR